MKRVLLIIFFSINIFFLFAGSAYAKEMGDSNELLPAYEDYQQRLSEVEQQWQIEGAGFEVAWEQVFPIAMRGHGEVFMVPAIEKNYHRLVLFFSDEDGNIVYKTDQLEVNNRNKGELVQPVKELKAVSFQDLNGDRLTDIVMIVTCVNEKGDYAGKPYKIGEALFQGKQEFYRDYRLSDKINRFGMNKSVESIVSFVRDGNSTEFLYTAATKRELLDNGFEIVSEQCYYRQFEKLGRLEVVPGTYTLASFATFMIYLINEDGYIVWSFQPMRDYENLYALKGITCRDIDGDGMKDILVLARYSNGDDDNEPVVESSYEIYYQRTGGFYEDTEVKRRYKCRDEDTVSELVERARGYWGWSA